jgi:DNA-binding NtrC family response regulator
MRILMDYPWPGNVRELENTIEHSVVVAKGNEISIDDLPPNLIKNRLDIGLGKTTMSLADMKEIAGEEKPCIWMKAGVIAYRMCTSDYDCKNCAFDQALLDASGHMLNRQSLLRR